MRHILRSGGFATLRLVRIAHGPLRDPALLAGPPGSVCHTVLEPRTSGPNNTRLLLTSLSLASEQWRHLTPSEVAELGGLDGMKGAAARRGARARTASARAEDAGLDHG